VLGDPVFGSRETAIDTEAAHRRAHEGMMEEKIEQ
jgi:hypothetical protein